jgi:hypothetical protein
MISKVLKKSSLEVIELKHYVDEEIFELELHIGNFMELFEEVDKTVD